MAYGTIKSDIVQSSTAGTPPQFNDGNGTQTGTLCRAWVNFNGTGTVAIRASFNVSSITDNGTGDYTVNFTTAMPDVNYSVAGSGSAAATTNVVSPLSSATMLTTSVQLFVSNTATAGDNAVVSAAIFR